jgi:hypothetical protein
MLTGRKRYVVGIAFLVLAAMVLPSVSATDFPANGATYYNNFSLAGINTDFYGGKSPTLCWIIFNGIAKNVSCATWNTSLAAGNGANNITWCCSGGACSGCESEIFTISVVCDASRVGTSICSGKDFSYVSQCKRVTSTGYQFDYSNLTSCDAGCFNGVCKNATYCLDKCLMNETMCSGNYKYTCDVLATGCLGWKADTKVFCPSGCSDGACQENMDYCQPGEASCMGNKIHWCGDDNGDGYYTYSSFNITECASGCSENYDPNLDYYLVSCNTGGDPSAAYARNLMSGGADFINQSFSTGFIRLMVVMVAMIAAGGFLAWKSGKYQIGLGAMLAVMFVGCFFLWVPWFVGILFSLAIGGLMIYGPKGDG